MKVKCERCKKRYELEEPKERNVTDEIIEVYFVCPHCDHEVHSFYKNQKVIRLMQENAKLQQEIRGPVDNEKYVKVMNQIKENKDKIIAEQEAIKEQLEKAKQND